MQPLVPRQTLTGDAIALNELYRSLQDAGFTQAEALVLVGFVMVGGRDGMVLVRRLLHGEPPASDPPPPGA